MNHKEANEEGAKKVLSLLTKKYQTTKAIKEEGIKRGMFSNWNSYNKYLEILAKEKKAEKLETGSSNLWKLK